MGRKKKPKKGENISFMQNMDCDKFTILHAVDIIDTERKDISVQKKNAKYPYVSLHLKRFYSFPTSLKNKG